MFYPEELDVTKKEKRERNLQTSFDSKCYHLKYFISSPELFKFANASRMTH